MLELIPKHTYVLTYCNRCPNNCAPRDKNARQIYLVVDFSAEDQLIYHHLTRHK